MISLSRLGIFLVSFFLASCVTPPTLYGERNPVANERIQSARIVFKRDPTLGMAYRVSRTQNPGEALKDATAHVVRIMDAVENHVPTQLANELQKKGVPSGSDVLISLRPTGGWGNTNTTPRIQLEITVQSSDRTKQPWIAKISDGSWETMPAQQTAQLFTARIVPELIKAGFLPQ